MFLFAPPLIDHSDPIWEGCECFFPLVGGELGMYDAMGNRGIGTRTGTDFVGNGEMGVVCDIDGASSSKIAMGSGIGTSWSLPISTSMWVYHEDTPNTVFIGDNGTGYMPYITSTTLYMKPTSATFTSFAHTAPADEWYHILMTWDAAEDQRTYVNGVQVGSTTNKEVGVTMGNLNTIGNYQGGTFPHDGLCALVGIWLADLNRYVERLADPVTRGNLLIEPMPDLDWVPAAAGGGTVPPIHYHHRHHNLAA